MDKANENTKRTLRPLRSLAPLDQGGVNARQGFAFQDHVAVRHCLEMLLPDGPREVRCETYDDITLFHDGDNGEECEFVQVKGEHPDQLWTCAKLCQRDSGRPGTSMLERSLANDRCSEPTRFRIVTSRQVSPELEVLGLPKEHADRQPGNDTYDAVRSGVTKLVGDFTSPKGNNCDYWLRNVVWDVLGQTHNLESSSKLQLTRVLEKLALPWASDVVDDVYNELLGMVKSAAEQPWRNREKKCISAAAVKSRIENAVESHPDLSPNKKLEEKLKAAGLDTSDVALADELRRSYRKELLTPNYLDVSDREKLDMGIRAALLRLRVKLLSGEIRASAGQFHALSLEEVRRFSEAAEGLQKRPPSGFSEGFMYELTSRCRYRFVGVSQ